MVWLNRYIKFILNLNGAFTLNFIKRAPVHFSPGFLQEQDFTESNHITADQVGKKPVFAEQIDPPWF
jgi:hypothetical protein